MMLSVGQTAPALPYESASDNPVGEGRVAFFGHDRMEPTIRKRWKGFRSAGWSVTGFMFVRLRYGQSDSPETEDTVCLGRTIDRHYGRRLPLLGLGILRAMRRWRDLREARILYARNLDMALIAWLSSRAVGSRAPLVYEVLDIQRLMLRSDAFGRVARFVERWLLDRSALLVVSSPDFVTQYFQQVQQYHRNWYLFENKIPAHLLGGVIDNLPRSRDAGPPWTIGWFGTLRCSRSLDILTKLARELGSRVRIVIAGRISEEDIDPKVFQDRIAAQSNIVFLGSYRNPEDLPRLYGQVHLTWSIDFLDDGKNSKWLLTNRIYEGGLFGSPILARAGTAVGRFVEASDIGISLPEPIADAATAFIKTLEPSKYSKLHGALLRRELSDFVDYSSAKHVLELVNERHHSSADEIRRVLPFFFHRGWVATLFNRRGALEVDNTSERIVDPNRNANHHSAAADL